MSREACISFERPAHLVTGDAPGLAEEEQRPALLDVVSADSSPRANRSIGASAKVSDSSNSAIALAYEVVRDRRPAAG